MYDDLTQHAKKFAPEYGDVNFSDHLPMAVTALRALGAEKKRIQNFAKTYAKNLKRKKMGAKSVDAMLLSVSLGDPEIYPEALNYFLSAIENTGRAQVLQEYIPELTKSIAAAAYHGVIRTAYGLLANENLEIAAGLAYWWTHAEPIATKPPIVAANDKAETLIADMAAIVKKHRKKLNFALPTISARLTEVSAHPQIAAVLARAMAADVPFEKIAEIALQMFLSTKDFIGLHCVTGVHATRILTEHVVMNDANLRASLWTSLCAAYAALGAPNLAPLNPPPSRAVNWRILSAAAIASDDEHDIKFVFSCMEEARFYGRDIQYRNAASIRLGLKET